MFELKKISFMIILANLLFSVPTLAGGSEDGDSSDSDEGQVILPRSHSPKKDNKKELSANVSGDLTLPYNSQILVEGLKATRVSPGTGRIFWAEVAIREAKVLEESVRRELARLEAERSQAEIIFHKAQQSRIKQETRLATLRAEEELERKQKEVAETCAEPQDNAQKEGPTVSVRTAALASISDVFCSDRHLSVSPPKDKPTRNGEGKKREQKEKKGRK